MNLRNTNLTHSSFSRPNKLRKFCLHIFLTTALIFLLQIQGMAQVVLSSNNFVTIASGISTSSISLNHDPGTDENRFMVVAVSTSRTDVFSATFDGEPLDLLGNVVNDNSRVVFFIKENPPSGLALLEATVGNDDRGFVMGVATFSNVDLNNPITFTLATGSSSTPTVNNVPTTPGGMVFSAISYRNSGHTYTGVGTNQVELWNFSNNGSNDRHRSVGSYKPISSGTTTSMSYSIATGTNWSIGAVSLNEFCVLAAVESSVNSCEAPIEGTITITNPVGGSGNYEYSINGGSSYQTSNTFTGLAEGSYSVFIRDIDEDCERDLGVYSIPPRVNIDNVTSQSYSSINSGDPINMMHYTGNNSNRLMLVGISTRQREIVGEVTYAGDELTFLGANTNRDGKTYIYKLLDPPSGNHTLTIAAFNANLQNDNEAVVGIITFHNVDPTNPIGDYFTSDASSNSPSLQITGTNENQLIFQVLGVDNTVTSPIPLTSGQVRQWEIQNSRPLGGGFTGNADEPNTTFNYGPMSSSRNWTLSGVAINPLALVDLAIEKTVDDSLAFVGKTITFTLEASNIGCDDASQVLVYDLLPSGFTYVSHTASDPDSYNIETGIWNIGTLNVGFTETLEIEALVNPTGDYTNTSEISSNIALDINPDNNESSVTITICQAGGQRPLFTH